MGHIYLISDTHFGDSGSILRYEGRPFADGNEMNRQMIERWNQVVDDEDTVYHLGDFACNLDEKNIRVILQQLKGQKVLVLGNHDRHITVRQWMDLGFSEVFSLPVVLEEFFILSHEPVYVSVSSPYANVFGHVHGNPMYRDVSARSFCACVERTGYAPVAFDVVKHAIAEKAQEIIYGRGVGENG